MHGMTPGRRRPAPPLERLREALRAAGKLPRGTVEALLQQGCGVLAEALGLVCAFAVRKEPDGSLRMLAHAGSQPDLLREFLQDELRWDEPAPGDGLGEPIRSGQPRVFGLSDPALFRWSGTVAQYGVSRLGVWPLAVAGEVKAALMLCAGDGETFDRRENRVLLEQFVGLLEPELELLERQSRMALLSGALSSAACAVFITDRNGVIEWVNDAFVELTGYSREELLGQTPRLIKSGHQDQEYYRSMHACIRAGKAWRGEIVNRRRDGRFYTAEQTITPIVENGRRPITHFVAIQQDISERKRMELEVRELMLNIEQARQQERCQLARELHDELGGSLASLRRDIEWLLERTAEPAHRERLQIMLELAQASLATARQVVAGLRPTLVDELGLVAALHWLIRDFVQHHDIAVHPDLPAELSRLDPRRAAEVYRVVQEALTNVAKHSHASSVTVRACLDGELVVDVIDNGVGLPPQHAGGSHSMSERASLMGGYLEIEQLEGLGTRVRLRVPFNPTSDET